MIYLNKNSFSIISRQPSLIRPMPLMFIALSYSKTFSWPKIKYLFCHYAFCFYRPTACCLSGLSPRVACHNRVLGYHLIFITEQSGKPDQLRPRSLTLFFSLRYAVRFNLKQGRKECTMTYNKHEAMCCRYALFISLASSCKKSVPKRIKYDSTFSAVVCTVSWL